LPGPVAAGRVATGRAVSARRWLAVAAVGFVAASLFHLATFTPAAARLRAGHAAGLLVAAFVPLAGMIARMRRTAAPTRSWRRLAVYDWRRLASLVPGPVRALVFAAALYVLMNLALSLALVGGSTTVEADGRYFVVEGAGDRQEISRPAFEAHHAVTLRLLSGHLLLFYLLPLVYFAFVDPGRGGRA